MLNNNGGYDVVYRDAYIVCEYEVDRACLEQLNAEACLNQVRCTPQLHRLLLCAIWC